MTLFALNSEELNEIISYQFAVHFAEFKKEFAESPKTDEKEFLSRKEAAELLGVSENTVSNMVKCASIPINKYKVSRRRVAYKRSEIEAYVETQKIDKDGSNK